MPSAPRVLNAARVSLCFVLTAEGLAEKYGVYVTSSQNADRRGHELAMRLRAAYAHLRRRSNLAFSSFGMTSDQYVLLSVLAEQGEATQQELVRRCSSDTATIGTMVSLLETKALVTRTPHPEDGRALSVKLTWAGRRRWQEMKRSGSSLRAELAGLFNERELGTLLGFLDRLAGAMRPHARRTANGKSRRSTRRASGSSPQPQRSLEHASLP